MGRVVVLVLLVMVVVVVLAVRSQSRSRCGGEPERRTQGLTGCVGAATELLLERMRNAECAFVVYSYENKWSYT